MMIGRIEVVDVVKTKVGKRFLTRKRQGIVAVLLLFVALLVYARQTLNQVSLTRQNILLATVQHGDLPITVDGYGSLTSMRQQLITSLTSATVKEIVLKPGAVVAKGSIIAQLENPELQQQLDDAEQGLLQRQANLRQLKLNNQRELLNENANLAELKSQYASARLRRSAEETLVKDGIVSQLTYQQSVLNEQQLQQRIDILQQRLEQLTQVQQEAINIELQQIKQQQGRVNVAQNRIDRLVVRAEFAGVLQRLSIVLGQSVAPGQELALIGSVTELNALVRVSQTQAPLIRVGQRAIIDTRQNKIDGEVVRINPIVENNTVEVEIALPKNLPSSARPQQNIDATIVANTLKDVTYLQRPVNIKQQGEQVLYRLLADGNSAVPAKLHFGQSSGRYVEIVDGASAGQRFIISDLSNYDAAEIEIN